MAWLHVCLNRIVVSFILGFCFNLFVPSIKFYEHFWLKITEKKEKFKRRERDKGKSIRKWIEQNELRKKKKTKWEKKWNSIFRHVENKNTNCFILIYYTYENIAQALDINAG